MGPKRIRQRRRRHCGVAAVEFAIVAPIFFMVMIGIIEIGRAIMVQQVLINASRVGARQATMMTSSESSVLSTVTQYTTGVGLTDIAVSVTPNPATAAAGTPVTVSASVNYSDVTWLPSAWFMGGKVLAASTVMRKEGF